MTHDCRELRESLHDLIDGSLGEADRRRIRGHLDECGGCRSELAALEQLREETSRLPREIDPRRSLWPAIESRLERSWWQRLAQAAPFRAELWPPVPLVAGTAAILALALGMWLWRAQPAPPAPGSPAVEAAASSSPEALHAQAELARSEDGMQLARRDLLETVQLQTEHLSPETVAAIEENMRIIDQAIGQIRFALEEDPLNHQLNRLLAAQYQQEAELLKRVSGV